MGVVQSLLNLRWPRKSQKFAKDLQEASPGPSYPRESIRQPIDDLAADIENELHKIMRQPGDLHRRIILKRELEQFWNVKGRDRFFKSQPWYRDEMEDRIMKRYLKTISILILVRFRDWDKFEEKFMIPGRHMDSDRALPFAQDDLVRFLGVSDGTNFFATQWIFCPMVIKQSQKAQTIDSPERRLPFIEPSSEPIGTGASARVFKEVIAPHYLEYDTKATNTGEKLVACKRVIKHHRFEIEFMNLESLRRCLAQHDRIMVNIATIIQSSQEGILYNILYDLASFDLETFLTTPYDMIRQFDSGRRGRNDSSNFSAADLIDESRNLADALDFLHDRLYVDKEYACAHNDLKPDNILVCYPDDEERGKFPVGKWKIADFGISGVKPKRRNRPGSSDFLDPTTAVPFRDRARSPSVSKTLAKREPGQYTAPEILGEGEVQHDARKGDIWSFGCVFSEVLAFSIRPDLVKRLRAALDGQTYKDTRFYHQGKAKPEILDWISRLTQHVTPQDEEFTWWVSKCADVILSILNPEDPGQRPTARKVRGQLEQISKDMRTRRTPGDASPLAPVLRARRGYQQVAGIRIPPVNASPSGTSQDLTSMAEEMEKHFPHADLAVEIPRSVAGGIRQWMMSEESGLYWVCDIPERPEGQRPWHTAAACLKDWYIKGPGTLILYHAPSPLGPFEVELGIILGFTQQLDSQANPGAQPRKASSKIEDALCILKQLLLNAQQPVVGIFYGLDPADEEIRSSVRTMIEAGQTRVIKLIFFTTRRGELLDDVVSSDDRHEARPDETCSEPLRNLLGD